MRRLIKLFGETKRQLTHPGLPALHTWNNHNELLHAALEKLGIEAAWQEEEAER